MAGLLRREPRVVLTGGGPRAAVLGSPVAHSLSPVMHRAAYRHLGLDWEYERHECDEAGLAPFLAGLDDRWRGLSLTMPLKEAALTLATTVDDLARDVGAVNTLVRTPGGWAGHNTDVAGVHGALDRSRTGAARRVLVLGSGATTRSVLRALADRGLRSVTFGVRAAARPDTRAYAEGLGLTTSVVPLAQAASVVPAHDLVVDTLPGGASAPVADALAGAPALPALFAVVYEGWPTPLAGAFAAAGAPVASGLDMLACQAAEQVRLMTGEPLDADEVVEVMRAAADAELSAR